MHQKAVLMELRAEIQHCPAEELEQRRMLLLGLVDQALAQQANPQGIIQGLTEAFCENLTLSLTFTDGIKRQKTETAEQLDARLERLSDLCAAGLEGPPLLWLFYQLEHMATSALTELAAIAQTTDPKAVAAQLEHAFFYGEWQLGRLAKVRKQAVPRTAISAHQEIRHGKTAVVFRMQKSINVVEPSLIFNAVSALNNNQKKAGATKHEKSGHDEFLRAWLAAGLNTRRAQYGEVKELAEQLGFSDKLELANKTWIPRWKKNYRQH